MIKLTFEDESYISNISTESDSPDLTEIVRGFTGLLQAHAYTRESIVASLKEVIQELSDDV